MQCSACRAVFSNGLDNCPRCKTSLPQQATKTIVAPQPEVTPEPKKHQESSKAARAAEGGATAAAGAARTSTLVEFPRGNRAANYPPWRKDLSERVRQIQERRAREAEEAEQRRLTQPYLPEPPPPPPPVTPKSQTLGLVPSPDAPPLNPLVVAALRRIERARQPPSPRPRASGGGAAAAAVARVAEEQYQTAVELAPEPILTPEIEKEIVPSEKNLPAPRAHSLVVVPPKVAPPPPATERTMVPPPPPAPKAEEPRPAPSSSVVAEQPARAPRRVFDGVVDDAMLARREAERGVAGEGGLEEEYDDHAPLAARATAHLIDLLVVAFVSSPFAAIIELTNGDWGDLRVVASMGGIVAVVAFLYLSISTILAGRTWGMSLVSLHVVDAVKGLEPTARQAVVRALGYLVSLLLGGLGLIYALFDAEGRTLHDHLSGTVVVRD